LTIIKSQEEKMETLWVSKFKATCPAVLEDVRKQKKRFLLLRGASL
jgi:hypothetical protein